MRPTVSAIATAVTLLLAVGCASGSGSADAPVTTSADAGPKVTLVTLGGSETGGDRLRDPLRTAWPQLLYRSHLPRRAVFVNFGTSRATVSAALQDQLPEAIALRPTVAVVWFGISDAFAGTPVDRFVKELTKIVAEMQKVGARVLVVQGPGSPDGDVNATPYTDQAARVAEATGADSIDLREIEVRTDGAQPEVADRIADALGPIR